MGGGRGDLHPPNTKIKLDHLDLGMSFDKHVKKKRRKKTPTFKINK